MPRPDQFPKWCAQEFWWDPRGTEEIPVACREVFEDLDLLSQEPTYARHPDLGWMVIVEDHVVWCEAPMPLVHQESLNWGS